MSSELSNVSFNLFIELTTGINVTFAVRVKALRVFAVKKNTSKDWLTYINFLELCLVSFFEYRMEFSNNFPAPVVVLCCLRVHRINKGIVGEFSVVDFRFTRTPL